MYASYFCEYSIAVWFVVVVFFFNIDISKINKEHLKNQAKDKLILLDNDVSVNMKCIFYMSFWNFRNFQNTSCMRAGCKDEASTTIINVSNNEELLQSNSWRVTINKLFWKHPYLCIISLSFFSTFRIMSHNCPKIDMRWFNCDCKILYWCTIHNIVLDLP